MATTSSTRKTTTTTKQAATTAKQPPTVVVETAPAPAQPIVFVRKKNKKKGKRRYTRGLKDIQTFERGMSRSIQRLSDAAALGTRTYYKESDKSARKKRDGAVRDVFVNSAKAFSDFGGEAARAPLDLARRIDSRWVWRQYRAGLGVVAPFFPFLR